MKVFDEVGQLLTKITFALHAASHVNGTDDIQSATAAQKGVATAAQITKLDGIEVSADVTDATNVNAAGATMNADTDISANGYVVDEDNMASNLATKVPTQQSVKAYADTKLANVVEDTTPQLGGDLELNDKYIRMTMEPASDDTGNGLIITATVDSNSTGIGCPLYLAADGHYDEADADTVATAPAVAMALETGTGSKKILLLGVIRNDGWAFTTGPGSLSLVYLSATVGTVTQTQPAAKDNVVQVLGFALSDDVLFFNPQLVVVEHV